MSSSGNAIIMTITSSIPTSFKMINAAADAPVPPPSSPSYMISSSPSLRRTLSAADMSASHSQKWLVSSSSSSSSAMKRAQSSEHLDVLGEDQEDHAEAIDNHQQRKGAFEDIWSSILSNKNNDNPPYVHPLVKRSTSSLSEKSLEVCTESLGSETGSDGFGFQGFQHDPEPRQELQDPAATYNAVEYETKEYSTNTIYYMGAPPAPATKPMVTSSSFPPPLPSLSQRNNLHMRSHRRDGRLVLEAVSVPSTTCLRALRCDGRLLLTLSSDPGDRYNRHGDDYDVQDSREDHFDDEHDDDHQNHDEEEDNDAAKVNNELAIEFVMDERASCRMIMSKLMGSEKWRPRNTNATVIKDLDEEAEDEAAPTFAKSLPPLDIPPPAASTALNAYEYYWRRRSNNTVAVLKPLPPQVVVKDEYGNYNNWVLGFNGKKITAQPHEEVKEVVVEKATAEYLVPFLGACKEPRRSLLFLEPYCIATS